MRLQWIFQLRVRFIKEEMKLASVLCLEPIEMHLISMFVMGGYPQYASEEVLRYVMKSPNWDCNYEILYLDYQLSA